MRIIARTAASLRLDRLDRAQERARLRIEAVVLGRIVLLGAAVVVARDLRLGDELPVIATVGYLQSIWDIQKQSNIRGKDSRIVVRIVAGTAAGICWVADSLAWSLDLGAQNVRAVVEAGVVCRGEVLPSVVDACRTGEACIS